jgi:hypothetical protein
MAAAGLGVLLIACNSTPEIPNDLRSNSGTYPGRGSRATDDEGTAAPEGEGEEQVLTGGRGPSQNPQPADEAGTTPAPDAGTTPTPTPDAGTTPTPNACASSATESACFSCCEKQNPGTATKWNQFFDDCICAANRCGAQCAQSWCAGFLPNAGDACDVCMNNVGGACSTQADAVCKQDATCAPLVLCDEASGCLAKP